MTMPLYIFDLDGTLALIDHRRHFVTKPEKVQCTDCGGDGKSIHGACTHICLKCDGLGLVEPNFKPDWESFHKACVNDLPNWPVLNVLKDLYKSGAEILIFSARSDLVYEETVDWLHKHIPIISRKEIVDILKMRPRGDFTPDEILKKKWLDELGPYYRDRLEAVFDDRDKVVKMWRDNGIACFQVAPGNV